MAEHLMLANTEAPPIEAGAFMQTETALNIFQSRQLVELIGEAALTMIAGTPGVGKTKALEHFVDREEWVQHRFARITFKRGER